MEYKDYYKILGVPKNAEQKEIQKAYRKLARQYHPDINPNNKEAEEKFKEINEAYEVVGEPEKRSKYDQFGQDWQRYEQAQQQGGAAGGAAGGFDWSQWTRQQGQSGNGQYQSYTTAEDLQDLFGQGGHYSDFFETLFGGAAGQARSQGSRRGRDAEATVQIALEEAYRGTSRMLSKDGRDIEVKIPAGVKTGSRVRVPRQGSKGQSGGEAGDLYLTVEVLPHDRFERRDDDLITEVEVPLYIAMLGGKVAVPTIDGSVQLTIPPETQNERLFRIRGRGMPHIKNPSQKGDLFAKVKVRLPHNLTDEQRKLFEQLRDLEVGART
jgi:curved DNA-binding protein